MDFQQYWRNGLNIGGSDVAISIPAKRRGRRFLTLSKILSAMELEHAAWFPPHRFASLKPNETVAFESGYCHPTWRLGKIGRLLVTDHPFNRPAPNKLTISFQLKRYFDGGLAGRNTRFFPIFFHPNILNRESYAKAARLAEKRERPIKILFAGNCREDRYNKSVLNTEYGIFNRHQIHRAARALPPSQVFFPESREAFETAKAAGHLRDKLVWIDGTKFRVPLDNWLELMGEAEYFLCTSGVRRPYCHNLNESAACGCVPILQHAGYYAPTLKDNHNAIVFSDLSSFGERIGEVTTGRTQRSFPEMSRAIVDYHEVHLSLNAAMASIRVLVDQPEEDRLTWVMSGR